VTVFSPRVCDFFSNRLVATITSIISKPLCASAVRFNRRPVAATTFFERPVKTSSHPSRLRGSI
jgi:hypothetical protein